MNIDREPTQEEKQQILEVYRQLMQNFGTTDDALDQYNQRKISKKKMVYALKANTLLTTLLEKWENNDISSATFFDTLSKASKIETEKNIDGIDDIEEIIQKLQETQ